jgi:cell wall-associated NlpC family hydrolase
VVAARGDLADLRLADRIFAPHYAAAVPRTVVTQAPLLSAHGGDTISEVLAGEPFDVLELSQGSAWGVAADGAVGFVPVDALGPAEAVTHIVALPGGALPAGSRLSESAAGAYDATAIRLLDTPTIDVADAAETLIGTPFSAGGRSSLGCDAGGLIVLALSLAGIAAPRFTDLQAATLGHAVATDAPVLRGDLLFWGEQAGIALDETRIVHAGAEGVSEIDRSFIPPDQLVRRRLP